MVSGVIVSGVMVSALAACSGPAVVAVTPAATSSTTQIPTSQGAATQGPSTQGLSTQSPSTEPGTAAPSSPASTPTVGRPAADPLVGAVIVLDPGHNGANAANPSRINALVDAGGFQKACNTTGTANSQMSESQANLALALQLADQLRARGATVVLTRDTDDGWGPCIDARGRLAGEVGADLLVSLHADGAPASQHGFHIIHPGEVSGYTDGIVDPSTRLAEAVRDRLTGAGFTPSTYAGRDGLDQRSDLGTLNQARVPAIMIEVGNMANADDAAMIASAQQREMMADAISAGIADTLAP